MYFSKEMIEKAASASSAEELLEMAAKEGIELSTADAETYFNFLTKGTQPLSDEELDQAAGGKGDNKPKFAIGQKVVYYPQRNVPCYGYVTDIKYSDFQKAWYYYCEFENGMKEYEPLESPSCGVKVVF